MDEYLYKDYPDADEFKKLDIEQKVLRYTALYRVSYQLSKDEALQHLKSKIEKGYHSDKEQKNNKIRGIYWITSVAASVVIFFGIWYLYIRKPFFEVAVTKGQHIEYQLPDGSEVAMNADSKITFRKNNFIENREMKLEGEAFFSVKKGKKFTIVTKFADIRVLGTSFNVFVRYDSLKVSCFTGKVCVTSGDQSLIITPGESITLRYGTLIKFEDKNINSVGSWRNGEFYFENTPLSFVFKEIERQFNVNFVVTKMNKEYFTGSFTNKNLVNALDIVCIPMGLTYEIGSNSKIFISEKTP